VVVTLHDLYPYDAPANFGYPKVLFNRVILKQCLRSVDAIGCVSKSTLQRLEVYAATEVIDKAAAVYNHVATGSGTTSYSPVPGWRGEPILLCVAQHRRNKNIVLAIQVFQQLRRLGEIASDARLVIVGSEGPETDTIHRAVRTLRLHDSVVFLSGITDAELSWCYCHCELLLAPSMVEGFGLPVVEAMLHQCRVVCSDIPAFREVGGSYCDYFSLQTDPLCAFVQAAQAALKSHRFRSASTECFSRTRIAEAYLRLYKRLCGAELSIAKADGAHGGTLVEGREQ
jgi:glycosyltransferase involved in cell wall biosynthesis